MKGILIYQPTSKSAPLADFIDGLDPRLREKILLRLYFLTQLEKPEMKEPHFKRFSIERYRDLWELRVKSKVLIDCYGHDLDLTQREMRYAAIPDLRDEYHPGMELESVVKVYDSTKDELIISVKETETNPILGAEQRHPVGSRRLAVISGKYGGGVFCNLPDGVVCMCNYSFQHEDSDFMVGENVMLVVQRYNEEKLQMFGKILSKW